MKKNKICHFTSVHASNDVRIFLKECRTLARYGYDVSLVAPAETENIIEQDGVTVYLVQQATYSEKSRHKRFLLTVHRIFKAANKIDADLYHFHDPELLLPAFFLRLKGKQVVYDVHEDYPRSIESKKWIYSFLRKPIAITFELFENCLAGIMSGIVAATPTICQRFEGLSKFAITVNNYPLSHEFIGIKQVWEKKEKLVCYVGGIKKDRGLVEIVQAMRPAGTKLLLAGEFVPEEKKELREMPDWSYVNELGMITREEVAKVFESSMAGLVLFHPTTNHTSSQPNKIFEYMSAGLPVICSDFPAWKRLIEEHDCGICVDPLDVGAISNAILYLVNNPEEAKRLGENGRKAVLEKYSWEQEGKKLDDLYKKLLMD